MDINAFEDQNEEYGEEQEQIVVENPVQQQQKADIPEAAQESSEEIEELPVEHTPSFFSQRFASDLIRAGVPQEENQENFNFDNVQQNSMIKKLHESDCSLNVNTFQMRQLLGQEKMAPELLPYQHALVETICKQINSKDREIQKRAQTKKNFGDERFYLNILKMEMERVKYMLKAYLRARIVKIEKHLLYIVEKDKASLLSPAEMEYAWTLYESKKDHFKTEFFDKISKKLNCMEDDIQDSMITQPNSRQFVFVRFLISQQKLTVMDYIDIAIKEDNIYYLPFDQIKNMLESGKAELI